MNLSPDLAQWQGQPRRTRGDTPHVRLSLGLAQCRDQPRRLRCNIDSSTRPCEQGYCTDTPHERMSSIGKTREWGHGGGDEVATHS